MGKLIYRIKDPACKEAGMLDTAMRSVRHLASRTSGMGAMGGVRSFSAKATAGGTKSLAAGSSLPSRTLGPVSASTFLRPKIGKPGMAGNFASQGSATLPGPAMKSGPSMSSATAPPAGIQPGVNAAATPPGGGISTKTSAAPGGADRVDESSDPRYWGREEALPMSTTATTPLIDLVLARANAAAAAPALRGEEVRSHQKFASDVVGALHLIATEFGIETTFDAEHARQLQKHIAKVAAETVGSLPVSLPPTSGRQVQVAKVPGPPVQGPTSGVALPVRPGVSPPRVVELPVAGNSVPSPGPRGAPATVPALTPLPQVHRDTNGDRVRGLRGYHDAEAMSALDIKREQMRTGTHFFETGGRAEAQLDLPSNMFVHQPTPKHGSAPGLPAVSGSKLEELKKKLRAHEDKETPEDERKESPAHQRMEEALGTEKHNRDGSKKASAPRLLLRRAG